MASVITLAFENWKAQEAASGKAVLLNEFVFANVPNLDPTQPISRNEKLPPANQIVHRQAVNKAGLASENAVAYSVTMGADVGNFDFNWIGLLNKASGTVAMITHAPTQKKLKNQNGQQGNVLTRSFILEFQGAAEETQIKTSAETWQIDFTARLSGIDEMQRLINVDSYGAAAFFNDGFEVTRSGEQYTVKKGLGYVGGLRGELAQNQILNGLRNTKIYADFSYQGNIVSQWNTVVKITSAATLNNYVDAAGFTHQVFAIASIDANGNVKDLRPMGALSSQETSALETRFKLDLSKKIDKANITHQMGNSTELVVSQQLLAAELGKKQPAGTYITPTELSQGLDKKFDKIGGVISGFLQAEGIIQSSSGKVRATNKENNASIEIQINTTGEPALVSLKKDASTYRQHLLPEGSGRLMNVGDYGFGKILPDITYDINLKSILPSQIIRQGGGSSDNAFGSWGVGLNLNYNTTLSVGIFIKPNGNLFSYTAQNNSITKHEIYSSANTQLDRNGYLRTASGLDDLVGVPIGGSILWNGVWDENAQIAEYFWPNEGRSFSATAYPIAAKLFPSLKLPDDRGYAIRIADNGRGIDVGRTVGTYQEDAIRNITGTVGQMNDRTKEFTGVFYKEKEYGTTAGLAGGGTLGIMVGFNAANVVPTANENRMKNVAKILITRMK